jgi:uncharacterized membrane protein
MPRPGVPAIGDAGRRGSVFCLNRAISPSELPLPATPPIRSKPRSRVKERLRAYFIAGILVTGPVSLTFYLAWLFVDFIDSRVRLLIPEQYDPNYYLPVHIPGLGLVVVAIGLTLIGAMTAGYVGRRLLRLGDQMLARMPLIRGLYTATKQIFETVLSKQSNTFREVVLVEWPRRGMWTIGFITGKTEGEIQELTSSDGVNIYVPTTPNPTSGYLVHVPRSDVQPLSMTVEEAIKFVISGGIVAPPARREAEKPVPVVEEL